MKCRPPVSGGVLNPRANFRISATIAANVPTAQNPIARIRRPSGPPHPASQIRQSRHHRRRPVVAAIADDDSHPGSPITLRSWQLPLQVHGADSECP